MKTLNKFTLIASLIILNSLCVSAQNAGTILLRFQPKSELNVRQLDLAQIVDSGDKKIVVPSLARGSGAGGWDPQFGAGKFQIQETGNIVQVIIDSHTTASCAHQELAQRLGSLLQDSKIPADFILNPMSPEQVACVELALQSLR